MSGLNVFIRCKNLRQDVTELLHHAVSTKNLSNSLCAKIRYHKRKS